MIKPAIARGRAELSAAFSLNRGLQAVSWRASNAARTLSAAVVIALCAAGASFSRAQAPAWPVHTLHAERPIPLNLPDGERFDASGLLRTREGELLTLRDRGPTLYRIELVPGAPAANLVPLTNCFTDTQLRTLASSRRPALDCEGIAQDAQGRLYLCDEPMRWILRCDPQGGAVERLVIDWSPVQKYFGQDLNASFEGIAIGNGKLYVANERSAPVIIVVDLAALKVIDHFVVVPQKPNAFGTQYSDLCWFEGHLFVLCRQQQVILEVQPDTRAVLAEYDYREVEAGLGFNTFNLVGLMEGLAVERDWFWLVTDNNGLARRGTTRDTRPVLLKCRRPAPK
jgi:hypothetical protein